MLEESWRALRDGAVRIHQWPDDDSAVAYDIRSGDTHMIGSLAIGIIGLLGIEAQSVHQLAEAVTQSLAEPSTANITALVEAELERLHTLRLVERIAL